MEPTSNPGYKRNRTVFALFVVIVLVSGLLIIQSALFTVNKIIVQGNQYIDEAEVIRLSNLQQGENIFRVNTDSVRRNLIKDLRIADVVVTRNFPDVLIFNVRERQPLALVATSYGFAQLDVKGMVLAVTKSIHQMNVPLITGYSIGDSYVGTVVSDPLITAILEYCGALDDNSFQQLSEIQVSASGELIGYTIHPIKIRLGSIEKMRSKAELTMSILAGSAGNVVGVEYIDIGYATPYIKFRRNEGQ